MVEVLKPGSALSWDDFQVTIICQETVRNPGGCGATLKVVAADLRPFHWFGTHFQHKYTGIACPLCYHINPIKDVPEPIREKVLKEKSTFDGLDDSIY